MLTWNSSPNAVSYTGKAVSTDGHTVMCEAGMNRSCQLKGLQCGKEYTFTVSASDGDCESPDSKPVMETTGEHAYLLSSYSLLRLFLTNPYQHLPITFSRTSSSSLFFLILFFPFTSSWMDPHWLALFAFCFSPVCCWKCTQHPELQHQRPNHQLGAWIHACELQHQSPRRRWNCTSLHDREVELYAD